MFALFVFLLCSILYFKYKGKLTPEEKERKREKEKQYIVKDEKGGLAIVSESEFQGYLDDGYNYTIVEEYNRIDIAELLNKHSSSSILQQKNKNNLTPIDLALKKSFWHILYLVVQKI